MSRTRLLEMGARIQEPTVRLYHGGVPGLRKGDTITPRTDTAHLVDGCPTCEARRAGTPLPDDDLDPSLIYVSTDREYASIYAAGYPRGALYQVETDGPMTPSPDPAPSWGVPSAVVVAVLDPLVRFTPAQTRRIIRRYMGGTDGRL